MTNRERIINTALCKEVDRLPFFFFFGPWPETVTRWHGEGLPPETPWYKEFGFDPGIEIIKFNYGYCPAFEEKLIEDKGDTKIIIDNKGILKEIRAHNSAIPKYLDYPVKSREDWEKLKKRLEPEDPARFPSDWDALVEKYKKEDKALQAGKFPYGLFGTLRDMMGVEDLLVNFYDQPDLIQDIMDYLTDFWIALYEKISRYVQIDIIHIWEDMSGCHGSLISPAMVKEFMVPNYKKIKRFADEHGVQVISLDTDGDCTKLVEPFMEGGINLLLPFEVAAGSDIVNYRRKYPDLAIMGGIDKREIAKGRAAIDKELARIAPVLNSKMGYFPALDHLIHPEISLEDFRYFVLRLKEIVGA